MNYTMTVTIEDPNTELYKNSELILFLTAEFTHNEDDYGNGHWVMIKGKEGFENFYDLRYDKDFHANRKISWLADWADNYWNGENGAYRIKSIAIKRK